MSVLGCEIGLLQLISNLNLLVWLENEVYQGDEVPDNDPHNEKVPLPEPPEHPHVLDVDLEHKGYLRRPHVSSKQLNHEVYNSERIQVQTKIVRKEGIHKGLFRLQGVEVYKKESQAKFGHSFCSACHQIPTNHYNER